MLFKGLSKKPFKYPTSTPGSISTATRTECVFAHESLIITETDDITKRVSVKILRLPEPPRLKPLRMPSLSEVAKKRKPKKVNKRRQPSSDTRMQQQQQQSNVTKRQQQEEEQRKQQQRQRRHYQRHREEIHRRLLDPYESCLSLAQTFEEPFYCMTLAPDKEASSSSCNSSMHGQSNDTPGRQNRFGAMLHWISSRVQDAFYHIRKENRCTPHTDRSWYNHANVSCPTIVNGNPVLKPQALMSRRPSPLYLESTITL